MGAGISPMGMNVPQQPQGRGKGGGGRDQFNQQLMNMPGFADSLQASQQRIAQDPNANMMPIAANPIAQPAGYDPNVHKPSIGFMPGFEPASGPSTIPSGMQGDQLRMQQDQQMSMDALNQARQAGLQVGPTPGQPPNPYASMPVPQRQQMNEQIRMQQMMQQRQMPFQMQPQMNNPMFGGLGALMAMRGFGGQGGATFSPPQMRSPFTRSMGRGIGGLSRFFR